MPLVHYGFFVVVGVLVLAVNQVPSGRMYTVDTLPSLPAVYSITYACAFSCMLCLMLLIVAPAYIASNAVLIEGTSVAITAVPSLKSLMVIVPVAVPDDTPGDPAGAVVAGAVTMGVVVGEADAGGVATGVIVLAGIVVAGVGTKVVLGAGVGAQAASATKSSANPNMHMRFMSNSSFIFGACKFL